MNIRKIVLHVTALFAALSTQAQNPIIQTIYTADPAPMVYNDTVYLYTGHDEDNSTVFVMKDWHCFTSNDMVNWTDCGSRLSLETFSWAKQDAWAGQCIPRNGKFYWYVPMTHETMGMSIGVAVSDSPTGPFKDALGEPLVHTGYGDIDPTVFIDDDGQAYLYWGNPNLFYVKLNEDMTSYSGDVIQIPNTIESFGKREGEKNDIRPTTY
jgi:beta-xylosidase